MVADQSTNITMKYCVSLRIYRMLAIANFEQWFSFTVALPAVKNKMVP